MSGILLETWFTQHLLDVESMAYIAKQGFSPEILPTQEIRDLYEYALSYYFDSGKTRAIGVAALSTYEVSSGRTYLDVLNDLGINIEDEPELTISDIIEKLGGEYLRDQTQKFNQAFAVMMSEAPVPERLQVASQAATDLMTMVSRLTPRRSRIAVSEGLDDRIREYEDRQQGVIIDGMSMGVKEIDDHILYIRPGEVGVFGAFAKFGKAQPLSEPVLTPIGWVPMGKLRVGDEVVGSRGVPILITAIHPQGKVNIYRVTTADGSWTEVCGEHLWTIKGAHAKSLWHTRSTLDIKNDLDRGRQRFIYLPAIDPVQFDSKDQSLDPYLLGLLLGDGSFRHMPSFSSADPEIIESMRSLLPPDTELVSAGNNNFRIVNRMRREGRYSNPLKTLLKEMGLWGHLSLDKFIPREYLWGSIPQRMAILQGILDTDGYMQSASVVCTLSSERLRDDLIHLVQSLGGTARYTIKKTYRHDAYVIVMHIPQSLGCPFRLERKAKLWRERRGFAQVRRGVRRIVSIDFVGVKEAQCITVEAEDHLYLTRGFIPTHNSLLSINAALAEWRRGRNVAVFTLENPIDMTLDRIACAAVSVDSTKWQKGQCDEGEVQRIMLFKEQMEKTSNQIHLLAPPAGQRNVASMLRQADILDVDSVIIDQMSHMEHPSPKSKPRWEVVREIMQSLAVAASSGPNPKPVLLMAQISRDGKEKADKRGRHEMEDFAESSEMERTPSVIMTGYQSRDMHTANQALIQIVAARRVDLKSWSAFWYPGTSTMKIRGEV